jgi:heptosyltransferase-1
LRAWRRELAAKSYDYILDSQGLVKSALLSCCASGQRLGFARDSAREPIASFLYQRCFSIDKHQHAVLRQRQLGAEAFGYQLDRPVDYGLRPEVFARTDDAPYLVFLHGTTWESKHWPETYWCALARLAVNQGFRVKLPFGNTIEYDRAERIRAAAPERVSILPKSSLTDLAAVLIHAQGVVGVDTGLGHLAAALAVPTVSVYGPTDPERTGSLGANQVHLRTDYACAPCLSRQCRLTDHHDIRPPCFQTWSPQQVFSALLAAMEKK